MSRSIRWYPMILPLLMLVGAACARPDPDRIVPGETTVSALKSIKGQPAREYVPDSRSKANVLEYADRKAYQVEGDLVVASFREPAEDERSLQYWKHQFKGAAQKYEKVPGTENPHGQSFYELSAPTLAVGVVYDPVQDRVIRVVKYAKSH